MRIVLGSAHGPRQRRSNRRAGWRRARQTKQAAYLVSFRKAVTLLFDDKVTAKPKGLRIGVAESLGDRVQLRRNLRRLPREAGAMLFEAQALGQAVSLLC